jgi:hypothetical protein
MRMRTKGIKCPNIIRYFGDTIHRFSIHGKFKIENCAGFFLPVVKYHYGGVDFWMKTA